MFSAGVDDDLPNWRLDPGWACAYRKPLWASAIFKGSRDDCLSPNCATGWIVIGLVVLILRGMVGLGAEINFLPYLWRGDVPNADLDRWWRSSRRPKAVNHISF